MEYKMKRQILLIIMTVLVSMTLISCKKKQDDAKSMEQLQSELGLPVRTEQITATTFEQILRYNATLTGIEESTPQAMVSDIITKITAKVGDRVNKGDIIVSFPANTPAAQYEQARTAFSSISAIHDRMQRLYEQGAISLQDYENVQTQYKVSKANLEASEQMIHIRAPLSGVITAIMVNPSERVFPGKDLFTVASTDGYKASIMVPESEIAKVKKGAKVTAKWDSHEITGRVSMISMAMDMNAKAFRIEAVFPGYRKDISYGVTADIGIEVLRKPNVIVVQRHHIVSENGNYYVWKAVNGTAQRVQITTGLDNQMEYEVVSGLAEGDEIITHGIKSLVEGTKIRLIQEN